MSFFQLFGAIAKKNLAAVSSAPLPAYQDAVGQSDPTCHGRNQQCSDDPCARKGIADARYSGSPFGNGDRINELSWSRFLSGVSVAR